MSFDEMLQTNGTEPSAPARRGLELRRPQRPVTGGVPQVSLLPREMRDVERRRTIRRGLIAAVVVAALATAGGVAAATSVATNAQAAQAAETLRTQTLSAQILKFADIQKLQQRIALGDAAVKVGASTQIDWQKQLAAIEADMPDGFAITTVSADGATAIADYPQGSTPIEKPRAATVSLTMTTQSVDQLPVWLRKLRSIPSYADATSQFSASGEGAGYNVLVTVHLNAKALVANKGTAH